MPHVCVRDFDGLNVRKNTMKTREVITVVTSYIYSTFNFKMTIFISKEKNKYNGNNVYVIDNTCTMYI